MSAGSRPKLRQKLRTAQRGTCCYCHQLLSRPGKKGKDGEPHPRSETLEHLHRLADGGTNAYDNMALACFQCNTGRGFTDWLSYTTIRRGELHEAMS